MKQYSIKYADNTINWFNINELNVDYKNWNRPNPGIVTKFQIAWNSTGLFLHGRSVEENILARADSPNCDVWRDSCMEFFFRPCETDKRYFNFEINPNGAIYCGIGTNMPDRLRILAQNEKEYFSINTNYTEDGWEFYMTVPSEFIVMFFPKYVLKKGNIIYANCHKCGADTVVSHSLSWSPYPDEKPITFHNSEAFGKMILE